MTLGQKQLTLPESIGQLTALPSDARAELVDVAGKRRPAHGAAAVTLCRSDARAELADVARKADVARERRPAHGSAAVTLGQYQLTLPESVGQLAALPQGRSSITSGRCHGA